MIISTNRMSTMNGNFMVAANESYGVNDIGRILFECEHNDMQIFNAILKTDFAEIRARQEGTMLESELSAMTEASAKELYNTIINALKSFWAKIKGVFKDAYAMIASYCVRSGKVFVATNKKAIDALTDNAEIKRAVYVPVNGAADIHKAISLDMSELLNKEGSASQIAKAIFKDKYHYSDSEKSLYEVLKKDNFEKKEKATLADFGGKAAMVAMLSNGSQAIKDLKKAEDAVEKSIKNAIKEAKAAAQKPDAEEKAVNYRKASTALTNVISADTRAKIRLIKFQLLQYRIALMNAINPKAEDVQVESVIAIAEMEEIADEDRSEMAPELAEEVLEIVADAIEKAADEVGGEEDTPANEPKEEPAED